MKQYLQKFPQALLAWFEENKRDMPWRKRITTPYPVWISEIMLQQTQVDTVIPYFNRFIESFPTVQSLADAPQTELLKMWEGLGYYSRARNLQKGAQFIANDCKGIFPPDFESWQKVSGVGKYTAAAICSIAYGHFTPVVDGNVLRVWARLNCMKDSIKVESTKTKVYNELIPYIESSQDASWFNQAMMEMGALVCRPKSPLCTSCALNSFCQSYLKNCVDQFPVQEKKAPVPHKHAMLWVIECKGKYALIQREERLWHGLFTYPFEIVKDTPTLSTAKTEFKKRYGPATQWEEFSVVKHQFTHFSLDIHPFKCKVNQTQLPTYTYEEICALPLPVPIRKVLQKIFN